MAVTSDMYHSHYKVTKIHPSVLWRCFSATGRATNL